MLACPICGMLHFILTVEGLLQSFRKRIFILPITLYITLDTKLRQNWKLKSFLHYSIQSIMTFIRVFHIDTFL